MGHYRRREPGELGGFLRIECVTPCEHSHSLAVPISPDFWAKPICIPSGAENFEY